MRAAAERSARRRAPIIAAVAGIAAVGVVATLAVVATGYESQEVPRLESSVWVTRDDGRYARVNTELAELDTVRSVDDPTTVVQSGAAGVVYSGGLRQRWALDPAAPLDLVGGQSGEADAGAEAGTGGGASVAPVSDAGPAAVADPTPAGTREVSAAGRYVVYRTDTGRIFLGGLDAPGAAPIDPLATEAEEGEEPVVYTAAAVGVSPDGDLAAYSATEGAVRRFDATSLESGTPEELEDPPAADAELDLAMAGSNWVLLDAAGGRAWVAGRAEPVEVDVEADAVLQEGAAGGDVVYTADSAGLVAIPVDGSAPERVLEADGVPAAPVVVGEEALAAWVGQGGGTAWSSVSGEHALEVPQETLEQAAQITPVIRSNGDRAVLNEPATGLVWTLPDGRLVPLEQWSVDDDTEEREGTTVVEDVAEQRPPVAVADSFGVRAGELVSLPVLLNDHDPNRSDVLTIAADQVTGLDVEGFGEVAVVSNGQAFAVRVAATSGTARFSYAVTDGQQASPPVTVTLTVVPDDQNSAPAWCGVDACTQHWPSPEILPGGTLLVPVLDGWVDPEGDAFVLADARADDSAAPVTVVPRADGRLAVRHTDPNAADGEIGITLTVVDARGATAERALVVRASGRPAITADRIAVAAAVGETVSVDVAEHVVGGSGSFQLVDAVASGAAAGLAVTPNASSGQVELSATEPGEYVVGYTVADTVSQAEQSATIRLSVVPGGRPLAIAPMTAYVRPGEDTTIDVFGAVQNATGRVLLVSGARSSSPELTVGVVASSHVRLGVMGGTAVGRALVGRADVTVTDGSGQAVTGVVSVFLAADAGDDAPIALPDSVTVRAGGLATIPVLANDVSPRGARLVVQHEVQGSGAKGELAFTSGDTVRYVAPDSPGTYRLRYAVAMESHPDRLDYADIAVTVLPGGANRPPRPPVLSARVLSGQTVEIPVPDYGVDPDGDRVVLAGVEQPGAGLGTASVAAEGDTVVYHAPADGVDGGQLSFAYTVRDPEGAESVGVIRVGVLAAELADAAPVTFSDYARATRGAQAPVQLTPLANDRDPALGRLELVSVEPNAPAGTAEYDRLAALVDDAALGDGVVALRAGDVAGTNSYVYTVRSARTSSTAQGLIVLAVGESAAVDHPVVADTVVTARTRTEFEAKGLDVVTGRVRWATGDIRGLTLAIWGDAAERYRVDGWKVSGELPRNGELVPFELSGDDAAGNPVVAYGLLRIPAFDDMPVQLRADIDPIQVKEERSAAFDLRKLVDLPAGDDIRLDAGPFATQREAATCRPTGAREATYDAGREAPWSDSCLVPLRIDGQSRWSYVVVPVEIEPKDPQAILTAISRTVPPGASERVDLYRDLTTWEGGREGDRSRLDYRVDYGGSAFTMTRAGEEVVFEARADAQPGTRETATVTVPGFGGITATITVVVGIAPPDAPRGATLTRECTVSAGSCTIEVVGVSGEYDPFAGKQGAGLTLTGVGSGGGVVCDVASVQSAGRTAVVATFPGGQSAFGGQCAVPFTVADAQGRTGTGSLTIDVLGYPQRPGSITTSRYTGDSVTLDVTLGDALKAHPPLTGVVIQQDGRPAGANCAPSLAGVYSCVVGGLLNGEKHQFTARAVNSVGESLETSAETSWAYQAPQVEVAEATAVYVEGQTTQSNAVVDLTLRGTGDTQAFRLAERNQTIQAPGGQASLRLDVPPGSFLVTVVPVSRFEPPIDGSSDGASKVASTTAAGAPTIDGISAGPASNTSIVVSGGAVGANHSAKPIEVRYIAWRGGGEPRCSVGPTGGGLQVDGGEVVSTSSTISGLQQYKRYAVKACGSNGFGVVSSNIAETRTFVDAPPPNGGLSYSVATSPTRDGNVYRYGLQSAPQPTGLPEGFAPQFYLYGQWRGDFVLSDESAPVGVKARGCSTDWWSNDCTGEAAVSAATAPTTVTVTFPAECRPAAKAEDVTVTQAARGAATVAVVTGTDGVERYTVTFGGAYAALAPIEVPTEKCAGPPPGEGGGETDTGGTGTTP
ncbi:Ig-like domain-containing protein [Agromyces sp. G08B096]|uniref:Ig-like domain-containing protein n=1 Tax=Agromyces sp. G08B096 TaxID=3156399 RepID=A0AAU7W7U6_9MICO